MIMKYYKMQRIHPARLVYLQILLKLGIMSHNQRLKVNKAHELIHCNF
ncbi:Uncharacterised protein [Citrobacter braakii]|nr:Uncharacterised protein [Citrobacter braakii]